MCSLQPALLPWASFFSFAGLIKLVHSMDFKRPLQEEAETLIKHFIKFLPKRDSDHLIMTQSHEAPGICSFLRN